MSDACDWRGPAPEGAPTAVGVHIFAGGWTVGLMRAGFDVLCHMEDGPYGVASARGNWPDLPVFVGEETWPLDLLAEQGVDLMVSNPPCAIFSSAGISTTRGPDAWRSDPRLGCWHRAMRAFEVVRPRVFALESVCQAWTKGREVVEQFRDRAMAIGWSAQVVLIDGCWAGLPQHRRRFFLVFHRPELPLTFDFDWSRPPATVGGALALCGGDPGEHEGGKAALTGANPGQWIQHCAPGERLSAAFDRANPDPARNAHGKIKGRPSFSCRRLSAGERMGAFIGNFYAHPTEDRFVGTREMRALCGYPLDFFLEGCAGGHASLLARAVMPPVGQWLAECVRRALDAEPLAGVEPSFSLVDLRDLPAASARPAKRATTTRTSLGGVAAARPARAGRVDVGRDPRDTAAVTEVPLPGEGSGKFIQRLWMLGRYSPEQLVAAVHANWEGRTTRVGDVRYNYQRLLDAGVEGVPPWPGRSGSGPFAHAAPTPSTITAPMASRRKRGAAATAGGDWRGESPARIVVTGFTRKQAFPGHREQVQKIDVPLAVIERLRAAGAEVDWSVCPLGEERAPFAAALVCVGACLTMHGVRYACEALWTVRQAMRLGVPVVLFYDDWKVGEMHRHLTYARDAMAGPFRRRVLGYAAGATEQDFDLRAAAVAEAADAILSPWPEGWAALCPMYAGWGDRERAFADVPARRFLTVDPTPVAVDLGWRPDPGTVPKEEWHLASLGDHTRWVRSLGLTWPVRSVGHQRSAGVRLASEADVLREVAARWGSLVPPYPHAGSGWFRARYVYAALAGRITAVGPEDAEVLGRAWRYSTLNVERMTGAQRSRVAGEQRQWLVGDGRVNLRPEQFHAEVGAVLASLRGDRSVGARREPTGGARCRR